MSKERDTNFMDSISAMDWKQSITFETEVEDQPEIIPHVGQKTGGACAFTTFQNGSSSSLVGHLRVAKNFAKPDIGGVPPAYFPSGICARFLLYIKYSLASAAH